MENKFNLNFVRFETSRACGIYDQNNLISLIESAFLTVKPDLLEEIPGAKRMNVFCAWDKMGGDDVKYNKSRLFCDPYHHRDRQRKLSERLTSTGGELLSIHGQTLTEYAPGTSIGVSLFDINGIGVDDYVKSILTHPKRWLDALITVE